MSHVLFSHQVQQRNTEWNIYISLVNIIPYMTMLLIIGSYSDTHGRRIAFILPCIGSTIKILLEMAIVYFDLPVWCFLFGVVEYFFGGVYTLFVACFAYIADTVPTNMLATRMAIIDAAILGIGAMGNLIVGYLIHWIGYFYPYLFCLAGKVTALLYAIFFIPESVDSERILRGKQDRQGGCFQNFYKGLRIYAIDNGTNRRWQLLLFMAVYFIAEIIHLEDIRTLFELNAPLCWNSIYIGYFGAFDDIVKCIAIIIAAFLLNKCFSVEGLFLIGIISSFFHKFYIAFVISTVMMFLCEYAAVNIPKGQSSV